MTGTPLGDLRGVMLLGAGLAHVAVLAPLLWFAGPTPDGVKTVADKPMVASLAPTLSEVVTPLEPAAAIEGGESVETVETAAPEETPVIEPESPDTQPSEEMSETPPEETPAVEPLIMAEAVAVKSEKTPNPMAISQPPRKPQPAKKPRKVEPTPKKPVEAPRAVETKQRAGSVGAGGPSGAGTGGARSGATRQNYRTIVNGALASALQGVADGRIAMVQVTFAINGAGRISSAVMTRGTGDSAMDGRMLARIRSVSLPPPPGGVYRGAVAVSLRRR